MCVGYYVCNKHCYRKSGSGISFTVDRTPLYSFNSLFIAHFIYLFAKLHRFSAIGGSPKFFIYFLDQY